MIKGLIIGHRNISSALLEALESISGTYKNLIPISNDGLSTREIVDKVKCAFTVSTDEEVIIFIDVFGGSCWRAAKMVQLPRSHIITGLNLPMLLSFVNKRETVKNFDDLPAILKKDGKRGIISE